MLIESDIPHIPSSQACDEDHACYNQCHLFAKQLKSLREGVRQLQAVPASLFCDGVLGWDQ